MADTVAEVVEGMIEVAITNNRIPVTPPMGSNLNTALRTRYPTPVLPLPSPATHSPSNSGTRSTDSNNNNTNTHRRAPRSLLCPLRTTTPITHRRYTSHSRHMAVSRHTHKLPSHRTARVIQRRRNPARLLSSGWGIRNLLLTPVHMVEVGEVDAAVITIEVDQRDS